MATGQSHVKTAHKEYLELSDLVVPTLLFVLYPEKKQNLETES